jgi:hypothetical protein
MARTYKVKAGDTLSSIAKQFYGDATSFPYIAGVNNLAAPYVIHPGDSLIIPDTPQHSEIYVEQVDFVTQAGNFEATPMRPVLAGWRLVIENVSGHYQSPDATLGQALLNVGIPDPPMIRYYPFPWVKVHTGISEFHAFNHFVRIYVDGPAELSFDTYGVLYKTPGVEAHGLFTVTGHLEALPHP